MFCAAVGALLTVHTVDDAALTLTPDSTTRAPAAVQYVREHPEAPVLYVAYSNRSTADDTHGVATYRIDRATGRLTELGTPLVLGSRPIHITVDPAGHHLLTAYNQPSALPVHALEPDGTIGAPVARHEPVDAGHYAHQVRIAPAGDLVVLSTRGDDATATAPANPGALKVFRFADGRLSGTQSVTDGDGLGFGPRHVDFHPTEPWMYVSMERSNEVLTYGVHRDGITPSPLYTAATVARPERRAPVQYLGPIRVHPNGRNVYLVNRSDGHDGENTVAVFSVDPGTGEPTLVQTIGIEAVHARTLTIHPAGKMLVTAAVAPATVREGDRVRDVAAGFSVFGVGDDGRLTFARNYEVDVGDASLFWCGMVPL